MKTIILCLVLCVCLPSSDAQTSELYMIYSPNVINPYGTTSVYQGGHRLRSWTHSNPYEIAPAVFGGFVRQSALYNPGSEYTLSGTPTGQHYSAIADTYDAASDGTWIYGWNWATASLVRYDSNWGTPQTLFSLGPSNDDSFMGITYDSHNNSIWIAPWVGAQLAVRGRLYDYSLDGQLLGSLALANTQAIGNGLAYDRADDTFWFFSWTDQRYEQYSRNGTLLSTLTGMTRIYGAEFAVVPEPSALALVGMGGIMLFPLRRLLRRGVQR